MSDDRCETADLLRSQLSAVEGERDALKAEAARVHSVKYDGELGRIRSLWLDAEARLTWERDRKQDELNAMADNWMAERARADAAEARADALCKLCSQVMAIAGLADDEELAEPIDHAVTQAAASLRGEARSARVEVATLTRERDEAVNQRDAARANRRATEAECASTMRDMERLRACLDEALGLLNRWVSLASEHWTDHRTTGLVADSRALLSPQGAAPGAGPKGNETSVARCRHVWVQRFAPWCRRCIRTALFWCSRCNEGRCYCHRPAGVDGEEVHAASPPKPGTPGTRSGT